MPAPPPAGDPTGDADDSGSQWSEACCRDGGNRAAPPSRVRACSAASFIAEVSGRPTPSRSEGFRRHPLAIARSARRSHPLPQEAPGQSHFLVRTVVRAPLLVRPDRSIHGGSIPRLHLSTALDAAPLRRRCLWRFTHGSEPTDTAGLAIEGADARGTVRACWFR